MRRACLRACFALGLAAGLLPAQADEHARVIDRAAAIARRWTASLPDFICTQTIRRSETNKSGKTKTLDVLTIQLDSVNGAERHELLAVNGKGTKKSYDSLGGVLSSGEFGTTLIEIFRPGAAVFTWDRRESLRGREVDIFRFDIDVAQSEMQMEWLETRTRTRRITVANRGEVAIERESGNVLRLAQAAYNIPLGTPVTRSEITMDFDFREVGGRQYLLAVHAQLFTASGGKQYSNEEEFRDYRKFTSDTSVSFEPPDGGK